MLCSVLAVPLHRHPSLLDVFLNYSLPAPSITRHINVYSWTIFKRLETRNEIRLVLHKSWCFPKGTWSLGGLVHGKQIPYALYHTQLFSPPCKILMLLHMIDSRLDSWFLLATRWDSFSNLFPVPAMRIGSAISVRIVVPPNWVLKLSTCHGVALESVD